LIQDFNPPKIWFYEECYIRFCTESYSLENIYNRYIHLTNNSIQKHSSKFNQTEIPGNMWSMAEFANHIGEDRWKTIQERIKDIVVWSIKSCEGGISARRNSCELVGYDFMIDEQLNPWLIEINMSPAMDYSTQITKRLVKSVMQDTVKVIADNNRNRDTGMFKCIYRGEETA
jgi:tubulin monoglycylase TTLL3/8